MKAYATEDGFVFWGRDAYDVVSKMRRADIFRDHESNMAYMGVIAERVRGMSDDHARLFHFTDEKEFLESLARLGFLTEITKAYACPIAHAYCNSRRPSCTGDRGYCWLKKQEDSQ